MSLDVGCLDVERVMDAFRALLDPEEINAAQPHSPATVYTPYVTVWLMVYQRLMGGASLESAVSELRRNLEIAPAVRRVEKQTLSANSGAYSQARTRLESDLVRELADRVCATLTSTTAPSFGSRRIYLIDGTTLSLPSDVGLRQEFPPASNQHGTSAWPVMHCAVAHDLASGCALRPETGAMYGPKAESEITLAQRLLARIPPESVLLADSNFGVFCFAHAARQAGHDVVTRLTGPRFGSMTRGTDPHAPGCWQVVWRPSKAERKKHPDLPAEAELRVSIFEIDGTNVKGEATKLWFLTTLAATREEIAEVYWKRQHVENDIRDVKVALGMDKLRSRSKAMLEKELALGIVTFNLVVQIRRLAAQQAGVSPRRLSFKGAWSLVKTLLLPNNWTREEYLRQFEWTLSGCIQRAIPNRPGRNYARALLRRSRQYTLRPSPT